MTNPGHEVIVTIAYRDFRSRFAVESRTEDVLRGRFQWTDDEKAQILALLEQEDEEGNQPWYLDGDGYRLSDENLFPLSPWTIVDRESCTKAVQRMIDWESGEAWFCLAPWFRIGDELNRRRSEFEHRET
ncbi:MAG: hypothetical protein MUF06_20835 [Pirellulaceae bacterium]|jgi:hypothetical protein|nr:hypothetical protein [Pirellulaceae bacterium]